MILAQWTGAWGMHSDEERAVNARQIRTISFAHYKITVQNCLTSAIERRHVVTCNIPGAFLQTDWADELDDCYIHFETLMVKMICDINPEYKQHKVYTHNDCQQHLYVKVKEVVYRTLMGSILFYNKLSNQLEEWGFKKNLYDECTFN